MQWGLMNQIISQMDRLIVFRWLIPKMSLAVFLSLAPNNLMVQSQFFVNVIISTTRTIAKPSS